MVSVTTDGNATDQLRGAIQDAALTAGPHTISVQAGTYVLTLGQIQLGNNPTDITITGAGAGNTIIDGNNADRILLINPGRTTSNVNVTISGITFTRGKLTSDVLGGGAILAGGPGSVLNISNCSFTNNTIDPAHGSNGGALHFEVGANAGAIASFSFTHCIFLNNSASGAGSSGGALSIISGEGNPGFSATIQKNNFIGNFATSATGIGGGAIMVNNGSAIGNTVMINYNRFSGNGVHSNNTTRSAVAVQVSQGNVNVTNNWWSCNLGAKDCSNKAASTGDMDDPKYTFAPYLMLNTTTENSEICLGPPSNTSLITTGFTRNSENELIAGSDLSALTGQPVTFFASLGSTSNVTAPIQPGGEATATFNTIGAGGAASVSVLVDNVPFNDPFSKVNIQIKQHATLPLAATNATITLIAGENLLQTGSCTLIGSVTPLSPTDPGGNIIGKVWVENSAPAFNGGFYLARHYEVSSENVFTAAVKLYFLQSEFDSYNAVPGHGPDMPVNATDMAGNKGNIRIAKKSGTSSDGSGTPGSYPGTFTTLAPASVTWNSTSGYWVVSFEASDFSGFFLTTDPDALPVTLVSFRAEPLPNQTVKIMWTTTFETNNKSFVVERSKDLKIFEKAGEVSDLEPESSDLKNYDLIDITPYTGTSYYRLSQTDMDEKLTRYKATAVILRQEPYGIFPNPVIRNSPFVLRLDEPITATVTFTSLAGRAIPIETIDRQSGNLWLRIPEKIPVGVYLLKVAERGQTRTHRLMLE